MNAVDLLVSQHRLLEGHMDDLMKADDPGQRATLLPGVGDDLTVHIASEEQIFYPAVRARRTEDILLESLEEHLSLKRLLADLLTLPPSDATFEAKFKVLKEQTEHHHKEEEENLFPKVRRLLDDSALGSLGEEMSRLQRQMRGEGDPRETVPEQTDKAAPLQ